VQVPDGVDLVRGRDLAPGAAREVEEAQVLEPRALGVFERPAVLFASQAREERQRSAGRVDAKLAQLAPQLGVELWR
jgi:hypothetical protein